MLVLDSAARWDDVLRQALRIGYDDVRGYLSSVADWRAAGLPLETGKRASVHDLAARLNGAPDAPLVLDVRQRDEFAHGHVPGALHLMAGDLPDRLAELPRDRPIVTICQVGYRSAVAAGLLERAGFADVTWIDDGRACLAPRRLPDRTRRVATWRADGTEPPSTFYILDVPPPATRLTRVRRHPRATLGLLSALVCACLVSPAAIAAADPVAPIDAPHATDHVLVSWAAGAGTGLRAAAIGAVQAVSSERVSRVPGSPVRLQLPRGLSVALALKRLAAMPGVAVAEPDYRVSAGAVSNDPNFTAGQQWGMYGDASSPANQYGSGAAEAWAAGYTGSRSVFVGVIDEGIQFSHPELAANIWTNPYDPVDGIDNDGNGYVDDVHGWDFYNNDSDRLRRQRARRPGQPRHARLGHHRRGRRQRLGRGRRELAGHDHLRQVPGPQRRHDLRRDPRPRLPRPTSSSPRPEHRGHQQLVGWRRLQSGACSTPSSAAATPACSSSRPPATAASNNDTTPATRRTTTCTNGGTRGYDCVIAVAAIDTTGARASFSNYGATTVDLGAPGRERLSTVPINIVRQSYSGTSMATPHVTGAVALCASIGGLRGGELRAALLNSVAPTASLAAKTVSGGRLDIGAMVAACAPATAPVSGGPSGLTAAALGPHSVALSWTDGTQNETAFEVQSAPGAGGGCGTFGDIGQAPANATAFTVDSLAPGSDFCFRVRATNSYQGGSASDWSNTATATTQALPDTIAPSAASPTATIPAPQTLGTSATVHLTWAPSADASGIVAYDLQFSKAGGTWTNIALGNPTATSADFGVTPGKSYVVRLRAHDGVGNVGAWASSTVRVNLLQEGAASVTYAGTFKLASLSGASGGQVRQTALAGRVATLTFNGAGAAFVTTLGPARGIVAVWLDGTLMTTLDLYSATLKTKRVVWTMATGAGTHTLEIRPTGTRNAASSSNRVDVDAFLVQP